MLKFSARKTWVSVIALGAVLVCGVSAGFTLRSLLQAREANVKLRSSGEMLAEYTALSYGAEVAFFRYLNRTKEADLDAFLKLTVQTQAVLKRLEQQIPERLEDLIFLQILAEQKNQRASNLINLIKDKPDTNLAILSELDRASSEVIAYRIAQIKTRLDSTIRYNTSIYEQQAALSRALLGGVGVSGLVLVIIFGLARRDWLVGQQLRLEEVEQQLQRDRTANQAIEAERQKMMRYLGHDLDTLLTSILSSAELLKRQPLPEKAEKHSDRILRASLALQDYLKDLRVALKATLTELQISPTETDLIQVARDALSSPAVLRHTVGHSLTLQSIGEAQPVTVDTKLLERSLINLLANAVKYSPEGGEVLLCVNFNPPIILEVCDRGLGIPDELRATLFTPFQRGGNVGNIEGTGLGLAFVWEVAIAHGWQIEVIGDARSACCEKPYKTIFRLTLKDSD